MGSLKRFHVLLFISLFLLSAAFTFAVGSTPATAAESDGWVQQQSGTTQDLFSVSAVDPSTAWAVGAAGTVLRTTDGGQTWEALDAGVTSDLKAVAAVSATEAWAGGDDGVLLHTEDGGQNWEAEEIPGNYYVKDIAAPDVDTCWVVGSGGAGSGGFIMKTEDDGETWGHQLSGCPYRIYSISAVDSNTAWAAGGETPYPQNSGGVILKTTDGGTNWSPAGPTDKEWFCIAACDGQNAIAWCIVLESAGFLPMFTPFCMKTKDGGSSWWFANSLYLLQGSMTAYPSGARMFDANDIWMVSGNKHPYLGNPAFGIARSENGGLSWCQQFTSTTPVLMLDIGAVDRNIAWAVGTSGTILHTTSGGYVGEEPVLASLSPEKGDGEEVVTLTGSGFGSGAGQSFVTFGLLFADIISWSDSQIICKAPAYSTYEPKVPVYVTTPGGTSNPLFFTYKKIPLVESVYPTRGYQFTPCHNVTVTGSGFQPGDTVTLVDDVWAANPRIIRASNVKVVSPERIYCTLNLMGAAPDTYDVVVSHADGSWGLLRDGFTVVSPCGQGSGTALLMLGASLGILSLAGSLRLRRFRKARKREA